MALDPVPFTDEVFEVAVTLVSGTTVDFIATEVSTSRSPMDGRLTKLNWTSPTSAPTLLYIDLEQVAAVKVTKVAADAGYKL